MSAVRRCVVGGLAAAVFPVLCAGGQTLTTLHSFAGRHDGATPNGTLLYYGGALFGTTTLGGVNGQGAVFKVDPATGAETVLHSFAFGADGQNPSGSLVLHRGVLFGTTSGGGGGANCLNSGCGTVFRIHPATGAERIVYRFGGGADGGFPFAGLIAQAGTLYGTTGYFGGGYGTVFRLDLDTGIETILHSFTQSEGHQPYGPVIMRRGALYGTTSAGGNTGCAQEGCGTVFKVDARSGENSALHVFADSPDGAGPYAGLVAHGGALYGTTSWGGSADYGTVFSIDVATGKETILHNFDGRGKGGNPTAGLIYQAGALYGTTTLGGTFNGSCMDAEQSIGCGVIFKVDMRSGAETVLYRFSGVSDGASPATGLIDQDGAFYGTTSGGGGSRKGTVFKLVP